MEVKPGYKQTEVGVIPEDWRLRPMLSAVRVATGQVDPKVQPYHSMTLVAPDHIESGSGRLLKKETAGDQHAISGKYLFAKGDIVYSKIRPYLRKAILADFEGLCSADMYPLKPAADVSAGFMLAAILGHAFSKYAESVSVRSGMPKINRAELAEYTVALPPTKAEQETIAEALSDADALIESLEQLLAKKRQLKQGAMQELLTGKKRLPGFSGEWEVKRLGDIGEIAGAGVDKKIRPGEVRVRLINYLDVYRKNFLYSKDLTHEVSAKPEQAQRCAIKQGDVFFTPTSEVPDDIGNSAVAMEDIPDGAYSYHVVRLRLKEGWDLSFRTYAFKTKAFYESARTLCEGSGTRYVITLPKFRSMSVLVPPTVKEQAAIATILSDMDADLAALEAKLVKARQLKQGMMQELVTGRVRLV